MNEFNPDIVFSGDFISNIDIKPLNEYYITSEDVNYIVDNERADLLKDEASKAMKSMCPLSIFIEPTEKKIREQLEENFEIESLTVDKYFSELTPKNNDQRTEEFDFDLNISENKLLNALNDLSDVFSNSKFSIKSIIKFFTDIESKFNKKNVHDAVSSILPDIAVVLKSSRFYLFLLERFIDETLQENYVYNGENSIISIDIHEGTEYILDKYRGLISPKVINFKVFDDSKVACWNKHIYVFTPSKNTIEYCRLKTNNNTPLTTSELDKIIPLYKILSIYHFEKRFCFIQLKSPKTLLITIVRDNLLSETINKVEKELSVDEEILGTFFLDHKLQIFTKNGPLYATTIDGITCSALTKIHKPYNYYPLAPTLYHQEKYHSFLLIKEQIYRKQYKQMKDWTIFIPYLYKSDSNENIISDIIEELMFSADTRFKRIYSGYTTTDPLQISLTNQSLSNLIVLLRIFEKSLNIRPELREYLVTLLLRLIALNLNSICVEDNEKIKNTDLIQKVQNCLLIAKEDIGGLPILDSIQMFLLIVFRYLYTNQDFVNRVFWSLNVTSFEFKPKYGPQTALSFNNLKVVENLETKFPLFVQLSNKFGLDTPLQQFIEIFFEKANELLNSNQKDKSLRLLKVFCYYSTAIKQTESLAKSIIISAKKFVENISSKNTKTNLIEKFYDQSKPLKFMKEKFEEKYQFALVTDGKEFSFSVHPQKVTSVKITDVKTGNGDIFVNGQKLEDDMELINQNELNFKVIPNFERFYHRGFLITGQKYIPCSDKKFLVPDSNLFLFSYFYFIMSRFCNLCLNSLSETEEEIQKRRILQFPKTDINLQLSDFIDYDLFDVSYDLLEKKSLWRHKTPPIEVLLVERNIFASSLCCIGLYGPFFELTRKLLESKRGKNIENKNKSEKHQILNEKNSDHENIKSDTHQNINEKIHKNSIDSKNGEMEKDFHNMKSDAHHNMNGVKSDAHQCLNDEASIDNKNKRQTDDYDDIEIPVNLLLVYKSVQKLRPMIYNAFQFNDKDSPEIRQNFELLSKTIKEKAEFLMHTKSDLEFNESLKQIIDFFKSHKTLSQIFDIVKISQERVIYKKTALSFINLFENSSKKDVPKKVFYRYLNPKCDIGLKDKLDSKCNVFFNLFYLSVYGFDKNSISFLPRFSKDEKLKPFLEMIIGLVFKSHNEDLKTILPKYLPKLIENDLNFLRFLPKNIMTDLFEMSKIDVTKLDNKILTNLFDFNFNQGDIEFLFSKIGKNIRSIFSKTNETKNLILYLRKLYLKQKKPFMDILEKIIQKCHDIKSDTTIGFLNVFGNSIYSSSSTNYLQKSFSDEKILQNQIIINDFLNYTPTFSISPPLLSFSKLSLNVISELTKQASQIVNSDKIDVEGNLAVLSLFTFLMTQFQNIQNVKNINLDIKIIENLALKTVKKPLGQLYHDFETTTRNLNGFPTISKSNFIKFIHLRSGDVTDDRTLIGVEEDCCVFVLSKKVKRDGLFWMTVDVKKSQNNSIMIGFINKNLPVRFMGVDLRGNIIYPFLENLIPLRPSKKISICYKNRTFSVFSNDNLQDEQCLYNLSKSFYPIIVTFYNECELKTEFNYYLTKETPKFIQEHIFKLVKPIYVDPPESDDFTFQPPNYYFGYFVGSFVRLKKEKCNGVIFEINNSMMKVIAFKDDEEFVVLDSTEENVEVLDESLTKILHRCSSILFNSLSDDDKEKVTYINLREHNKSSLYLLSSLSRFILILYYSFYNLDKIELICKFCQTVFEFCDISSVEDIFTSNLKRLLIDFRSKILDFIEKSDIQSKNSKIMFSLLEKTKPFANCLALSKNKLFIVPNNVSKDILMKKNEFLLGHYLIDRFVKDDNTTIPLIHLFMVLLKISKNDSHFLDSAVYYCPKIFPENDFLSNNLLGDLLETFSNCELNNLESMIYLTNFVTYNMKFEENMTKFSLQISDFRNKVIQKLSNFKDVRIYLSETDNEFVEDSDNYLLYLSFKNNRSVTFYPICVSKFLLFRKIKIILDKKGKFEFDFSNKTVVTDIFSYFSQNIIVIETAEKVTNGLVLPEKFTLENPEEDPVYLTVQVLVDDYNRLETLFTKICENKKWNYSYDEKMMNGEEISEFDSDTVLLRKSMLEDVTFFVRTVEFLPWNISFEESCRKYDEALFNFGYCREPLTLRFNRYQSRKFHETDLGVSLFHQFTSQIKETDKLEYLRNKERIWKTILISEEGIDSGGPMREVYFDICKEIVNPNNKIFVLSNVDKEKLFPNTVVENEFDFICAGALIGCAAVSYITFDFNFSPFVWRYLCGIDLTIDDIYSIDNSFRDFVSILENSNSKESFSDVNWSVTLLSGEVKTIKPEKVDFCDKDYFIEEIKKIRINELKNSMELIRKGFYIVSPVSCNEFLTPKYLEQLCRGKTEITSEDIKMILVAKDYDPELLFKVIDTFSEDNLRDFLRFSSGYSSIPAWNYTPFISIYTMNIKDFENVDEKDEKSWPLPTASTCFMKLLIPQFTKFEILREKLLTAIASYYILQS